MITDINFFLNIKLWLKNKKRVVSTLFLFLFTFGCDFESPEKWEMPAWYVDFTLPLTDLKLSFEEILNDSTIVSDTSTNISYTSSDIIYVNYPIDIPPQSLPDDIFNLDGEALGVAAPSVDVGEPVNVPITNFSIEIPISIPDVDTEINGCFPGELVEDSFPDQSSTGEIEELMSFEDAIFSVNKVISDSGYWRIIVGNNFSFPMGLSFTLSNGSDLLCSTGTALSSIAPYDSGSHECTISVESPETIDLQNDLSYDIVVSVPEGQTPSNPCTTYVCMGGDTSALYADENCQNQCGVCVPFATGGWPVQDIPFGLNFSIEYVSKIKSVEIEFAGSQETMNWKQVMPGYEGFSIKKAMLTESVSSDTNMLLLDITNSSPIPFNLEINMLNFFKDEGDWNYLTASIVVPSNGSISSLNESGQIDFGGYMLASDNPNIGLSNLTGIDSLGFSVTYGMDAFSDVIEVVDGKIDLGISFDGFKINNMSLEYIAAITENMQLPVTESPDIEGLPQGLSDIEFMDMIIEMELFNEIGIPINLDLEVIGIKEGINNVIFPLETALGVPIDGNYGCNFDEADTAKTLIKSNREYQVTEYYCSVSDTEPSAILDTLFFDGNNDNSSLVELINFIPEKFSVGGDMVIDGEGVLQKKSGIWGELRLISPLSFIFKKSMTVIPSSITTISPMDISTVEQIDSTMIETSLYAEIINRSSAGGNLSILISDSTIFPLFLDSLITGSWDDNLAYQQSTFGYEFYNNTTNKQPMAWDSLGISIDSIFVQKIDDIRAQEVQFFNQGNLQFFIGRLIDLNFFPSEINNVTGLAELEFPGVFTSISTIDTSLMNWVITDELRYTNAMITFDGSVQDINGQYDPITLQTVNLLEIQTMLTLKLDTGGFTNEGDD